MGEKFIENLIEDFFETGVMKCSIFQLQGVYNFSKEKLTLLMKEDPDSNDTKKWGNLLKILLIYLTETDVAVYSSNKNFKVSFNDYLIKIYGISEGEVPIVNESSLFSKYVDFTLQNCCNKCLDMGIVEICSKCQCYEIWSKTNN